MKRRGFSAAWFSSDGRRDEGDDGMDAKRLAHGRWKRIAGAAVLNEDNMAVHQMPVWGQLPAGTWMVKRPLSVSSTGTPLYLTFRVRTDERLMAP
jgi:hypothetical protein